MTIDKKTNGIFGREESKENKGEESHIIDVDPEAKNSKSKHPPSNFDIEIVPDDGIHGDSRLTKLRDRARMTELLAVLLLVWNARRLQHHRRNRLKVS